jgi:hypothetical protein
MHYPYPATLAHMERLDRAEAVRGLKPWTRYLIRSVYDRPEFPSHYLAVAGLRVPRPRP